jgi:carbon-monoxide dehydrogenase small subunit
MPLIIRLSNTGIYKMKKQIKLKVNGQEAEILVEPRDTLLDVLRYNLGLTGTKEGCGNGNCGSCTVLLDGKAIDSCLMFAIEAEGYEISTIEGLAKEGKLHPLQQAFIDEGAIQCGFCTPGFVMSAKALLDSNPNPTENEIRQTVAGNLCRCTGYDKIVRAILKVAAV